VFVLSMCTTHSSFRRSICINEQAYNTVAKDVPMTKKVESETKSPSRLDMKIAATAPGVHLIELNVSQQRNVERPKAYLLFNSTNNARYKKRCSSWIRQHHMCTHLNPKRVPGSCCLQPIGSRIGTITPRITAETGVYACSSWKLEACSSCDKKGLTSTLSRWLCVINASGYCMSFFSFFPFKSIDRTKRVRACRIAPDEPYDYALQCACTINIVTVYLS